MSDSGIRSIIVVGAGTMGHGIAQTSAAAGCQVALCDITEEVVQAGMENIRSSLGKRVAKGKLEASTAEETLSRIRTGTDPVSMI